MSNTLKIMMINVLMSGAVYAAQHQPKQPDLRVAAVLGHLGVKHTQVVQKPVLSPVFVHQPSFALAQSQGVDFYGKPVLVRVHPPCREWPQGHSDFMMDAPHLRVAALLGHLGVKHSQVVHKPAALPVGVHQPRYVKCFDPNQGTFF